MRVAQVAPPFQSIPPAGYGGTERVVSLVTEELVRRGHDVTLFASGDSTTSARLIPTVDTALWRAPEVRDPLVYWAITAGMVYGAAADGRFDVIHSHLDFHAFTGGITGIGFYFMGLPNPLLLAVLAALGELIPMIGPLLGFAPAVVVALLVDPSLALIVVVYALVIQQIEGNILVPRIMGHTVGVSPLTVVLGILLGAILYGLPGAFLAIPVAGAVQVILAHVLGMEDPVQAEAHVPGPSREAAQRLAPPQGPSTVASPLAPSEPVAPTPPRT